MNIVALSQRPHDPLQPVNVRNPVDGCQCVRIGGLHTDLQLGQPRSEGAKQLDLLLLQNIRGDLKVKISDTIVIFFEKLPDLPGMGMMTVKGPVDELHLCNLLIEKKPQFLLHQFHLPEPHLLL